MIQKAIGTPTLMTVAGSLLIVQRDGGTGTWVQGACGMTMGVGDALPANPWSEPLADWFWYHSLATENISGSAVEVRAIRYDFRTKSPRKIPNEGELWFAIESDTGSTANWDFMLAGRYLVKNP